MLLFVAALTLLGTAHCGGGGGDENEKLVVTTVMPGQGITIQQVDFDWPAGQDPNSTWGRLVLDPAALRKGGLEGGYVSLVTEKGWAVTNVPMPPPGGPKHVIYFDLGLAQSTPIGQIDVDAMHSSQPLDTPSPHLAQRISWSVAPWVSRALGVGPVERMKLIPTTTPPQVWEILERPLFAGLTFAHYQDVTNVQCAVNQCFPMATANGLQFLEDSGVLTIPHDHAPGIGIPSDSTSNTLVGQLDLHVNRSVTSRTSGVGVWFSPMIEGTFEYLQDHGLDGVLTFRHQDDGYPSGEIPAGSFSAFGSTSVQDATTVDWQWIDDRVQEGCAIVMVFIPHAVRITGSGRTMGRAWIRYSHDASQYNDSAGLEEVIAFLDDPDGNNLLNMNGSNREIRWVWAACP